MAASLAIVPREPPGRAAVLALPPPALAAVRALLHEAHVVRVLGQLGVARHVVRVLALVAAGRARLLDLVQLRRRPLQRAAQPAAQRLALAVPRLAHRRRLRVVQQPLPLPLRARAVPQVDDARLTVDLHVCVRPTRLRDFVERHVQFTLHPFQLLLIVGRAPRLLLHEVEHVLLVAVHHERERQQVGAVEDRGVNVSVDGVR